MARISGVNIPSGKRIEIALTYIFGIGEKNSNDICKSLEIPNTKRVNELTDDEILKIIEYMWLVMLADGHVDDFEAALMRKIIGLFHLTGKDSAKAKENALASINNQS